MGRTNKRQPTANSNHEQNKRRRNGSYCTCVSYRQKNSEKYLEWSESVRHQSMRVLRDCVHVLVIVLILVAPLKPFARALMTFSFLLTWLTSLPSCRTKSFLKNCGYFFRNVSIFRITFEFGHHWSSRCDWWPTQCSIRSFSSRHKHRSVPFSFVPYLPKQEVVSITMVSYCLVKEFYLLEEFVVPATIQL